MKNHLWLATLIIGLLWTAPVFPADFNAGIEAARKGDYTTAFREFEPLAQQGDASAQNNLGRKYFFGMGILRGYTKAHMWANIAASNGGNSEFRKFVEKKMTSAQIAEAQNLARECVQKEYKGC